MVSGLTDNIDRIVQTIRELAREYPERTAACMYLDDYVAPCCIVGVALHKHGASPAFLESVEGFNGAHAVRDFLGLDQAIGDEPDPRLAWISSVQEEQDATEPWGRAVYIADTEVEDD